LRSLVLDASPTLSWCFEDEATAESEALLDLLKTTAIAAVPAIWRVEVANALLVAERKKRISAEKTEAFLNRLLRMNIVADPEADDDAWHRTVNLARDNGLTSYDASYLDLAIRMNVPIATKDAKLIQAAVACGVSLFQP